MDFDTRLRTQRGRRFERHVRVSETDWKRFAKIGEDAGVPPGVALRRALAEYLERLDQAQTETA